MDLADAKEALTAAIKLESHNQDLGTTDVRWLDNRGEEIASGYFSEIINAVYFPEAGKFVDSEASELRKCFAKELQQMQKM